MPATPAWPPKSLPRLFVRAALREEIQVELDPKQVNYLGSVLRMRVGGALLLFDGTSGEWLARIADAGKKRMTLVVERNIRAAEAIPDVWLAFAPIKRAQTDWLVEKATELGVARLLPVMTERTIAERVRRDRLEAIVIEAAEQCGRTRLPDIAEPEPLPRFLAARDPARTLYYADEARDGQVPTAAFRPGPALLLTGPEGGFTDGERNAIRPAANSVSISLGPRILRAETAALAALASYMTVTGDWR